MGKAEKQDRGWGVQVGRGDIEKVREGLIEKVKV